MANYRNITLGWKYRDWDNMKVELAIDQLIEDNASDDVVYTDWSVHRGDKSGFLASVHGGVVAERSGQLLPE
uniref:Uncharacterized protein n=1 Tax=Arion vulgaris TaxID=1028688 RepID=A0A0B7A700_9EUPU